MTPGLWTDGTVLHWGPDPMPPEHPVERWEPMRFGRLVGNSPNVEYRGPNGVRYRNDEHGCLWRRALHGGIR
jgi:hypothetical protein